MARDRSFSVVTPKPASPPGAVSPGFVPGQFAGVRFDMDGYRRAFPSLWSAFLRAHFRDRIHVAYEFSVDERTARNWWDGVNSPRPEVVMVALDRFPAAFAMLRAA